MVLVQNPSLTGSLDKEVRQSGMMPNGWVEISNLAAAERIGNRDARGETSGVIKWLEMMQA